MSLLKSRLPGAIVAALGAIVATLVLFGMEALATPSAAEAQSQDFGYTVRIRSWDESDAELRKALDQAKAAGVNTIDFEVGWAWTSLGDSGRGKRKYNWYATDRLVREAEARGMKVTFLLTSTPDWVHPNLESTEPDLDKRRWTAPKGGAELRHWSKFVRDIVGRYKGRVSHYEMWNEPNHPVFWRPAPDPAEYAALLRAGYLSAKKADPRAVVVFGGLANNDLGYLTEYYRVVKDSYPHAASRRYYFDVLGVHPYSYNRSPDFTQAELWQGGCCGPADVNFLGFKKMKQLMEDEADRGKNLFLGEYGFSTKDTWMPAVADSRRALYLKRAYEMAREVPYVEGLSWYAYHPHLADDPAWTLLDEDSNPSLTYRAYKQVTGAESSNVKIDVDLPGSVSGAQSINPRLTSLSGSEVELWELWVDGGVNGIKPVQQTTIPLEWDTSNLSNGQHQVMVAAYTKDGSVWHSNVAYARVSN